MSDIVIGCDIGTQSCKALAMDPDGAVIARASASYPTAFPRPGWAQQDPTDWTRGLGSVVRAVAHEVGPERVVAIAVAGQVDGVVSVDRAGDPLGPAIIWMDRRATTETAALAERLDPVALRVRTGLNLDASHGAPRMAWLRAQERAGAAPVADGYLLAVTYAVAWLTGERVVDPANASTTLLLDLATGHWAPDLLDLVGVDAAMLGRVLPAHEACGVLRPNIARELGLGSGVRVMVGTGDEHAACLAAAILEPGLVGDITGTAEPVCAAATSAVLDATGLLETHPHAVAGRWLLENPGFVSGGSLRWLADAILGLPERAVAALAAEAPAGSDGLVFVPALGGAMTPRWNDRARGTFHGLRLGHDRRHLARAVLEGCAFALRDIVERLDAMGLAGDRIRVLGGGARDPLWLAIKADVTGRVVERLAEPEASAYGAALLAAAGLGWYPDPAAAARATVRLLPGDIEPRAEHRGVANDGHGRYRAIFDALEPIAMERP